MAESAGEKTELPTPKKLRDARNKGQVCTSKEIASTAILLALFLALAAMSLVLVEDFTRLANVVAICSASDAVEGLDESMRLALWIVCKHSFLYAGVAALVAIIANVAQIGFLFTFEPLKPTMDKINPFEGAKKIFSKKNLFEFLKNCVKVVFLSYLTYKIIVASIPELVTLCYGTLDDIFPCLRVILKRLAVYTAFGYLLIAAVDRLFQSRNFTKQMMMTKDEVKREYKEMEGSAEVKQAQRQFRDEILNGPDPRPATKKANVIVTNPTHISVGIRYDATEAPLPRIIVMGADKVAKIIRETAQEAGIPLFEDVPLARALWAQGRVDDLVPEDLLEPVAEVLKWVRKLEDARKEEAELEQISL